MKFNVKPEKPTKFEAVIALGAMVVYIFASVYFLMLALKVGVGLIQ